MRRLIRSFWKTFEILWLLILEILAPSTHGRLGIIRFFQTTPTYSRYFLDVVSILFFCSLYRNNPESHEFNTIAFLSFSALDFRLLFPFFLSFIFLLEILYEVLPTPYHFYLETDRQKKKIHTSLVIFFDGTRFED